MKKSWIIAIWLTVMIILALLIFKPIEKPKKIAVIQKTALAEVKTNQNPGLWLPEKGVIVFMNRPLFLEGSIKERLLRELKIEVAKYKKSRGVDFLKNDIWLHYVKKELKKAEIHPDLIYLPIIESTMQSTAISSAGAGGKWQLMPDTATSHGLKTNSYVDERFDPVKSTSIAIKHIAILHERFGDWTAAVGGYNMNPATLEKTMDQKNTSNFYSLTTQDIFEETYRFPFRILATKLIFENPEKYGFSKAGWLSEDTYNNWEIVEIDLAIQEESSIEKIVGELKTDFPDLRIDDFRKFNPHILGDKLPRGNFTAYILRTRSGTS